MLPRCCFYPSGITGNTKAISKAKEKIDTIGNQMVIYTIIRTDSLTISGIEDLNFITKTVFANKAGYTTGL